MSGRPLVPATSAALHGDTAHRVLELEKRLGGRAADVDFMVVACGDGPTSGSTTATWRPPGRCTIWGLHVSRTDAATPVLTVTMTVTGTPGFSLTCVVPTLEHAAFTATPTASAGVRLSPDNLVALEVVGGGLYSGRVVAQVLCRGDQPGSAGLRW